VYDAQIKEWHVYAHWEHILDLKSVAHDGLPWSGVPKAELPRYSKTMCPQADDYLSRAIMVNVNWAYTLTDCKAIASAVNKVLRAL
jgi:hypothetical protein